MRTVILALGLLLLAARVSAQPDTRARAVSIHELTITGFSQISIADIQAIQVR
jgi:hypothetical protein